MAAPLHKSAPQAGDGRSDCPALLERLLRLSPALLRLGVVLFCALAWAGIIGAILM